MSYMNTITKLDITVLTYQAMKEICYREHKGEKKITVEVINEVVGHKDMKTFLDKMLDDYDISIKIDYATKKTYIELVQIDKTMRHIQEAFDLLEQRLEEYQNV